MPSAPISCTNEGAVCVQDIQAAWQQGITDFCLPCHITRPSSSSEQPSVPSLYANGAWRRAVYAKGKARQLLAPG